MRNGGFAVKKGRCASAREEGESEGAAVTPDEMRLFAKYVADEIEARKHKARDERAESTPAPAWAHEKLAEIRRRKGPPKRRRAA